MRHSPSRSKFHHHASFVAASSFAVSDKAWSAAIMADGEAFELSSFQEFEVDSRTNQVAVSGPGHLEVVLSAGDFVIRNGQLYVSDAGAAALANAGFLTAGLFAGASVGSVAVGAGLGYLFGAAANSDAHTAQDEGPQNEAPVFVNSANAISIDELGAGQTFVRVPATDDQGAVTYSLSAQSVTDGFAVDQDGYITTTKPIIFEDGASRLITVIATDSAGLATEFQITVNLNDVNSVVLSGTWADLGMTHHDSGGYGTLGDWFGFADRQQVGFLTTSSTGNSFKAFTFADLMVGITSQAGATETIGKTPVDDITPFASYGLDQQILMYHFPGPGEVRYILGSGTIAEYPTFGVVFDSLIRDSTPNVSAEGTPWIDVPNEFDGLINEHSIWVGVDFDDDISGEAIIYNRVDNSITIFDTGRSTRVSDQEPDLKSHFLTNLDVERDSGFHRSEITNIEFANFDGVGGQDDLEMLVTSMTGFAIVELA